jgi:chemotaxis protein methyltransferase CheR
MSPTIALDGAPVLNPREFEQISKLAYDHFGLDLRNGKQGLIAARLGKKLRELGLKSFQHYYDYVQADTTGAALATMVDFLTTNHTSFFREPRHFDFLRETIFPSLRDRAHIHIWSAACSSGEEPYSIAMSLLEESREDALAKVRIKATDISTRVLDRAKRGIYPAERFTGIPTALLQRYLLKGQKESADSFRFKGEVRAMVDFAHLNLMGPLPEGYRCSVIFCRNIMIYFDKPTQQDLVRRLAQHLEPGGHLLIGHSESLNSITHEFEYVSPATYRLPGGARIQPARNRPETTTGRP